MGEPKDVADLMIDIARLAKELQRLRQTVRELVQDVEGLRHELGRPKPTAAEQIALALMGRE